MSSEVDRLIAFAKDQVTRAVRWVWGDAGGPESQPPPPPPPEPRCRHGNEPADCENVCCDCGHPCRGHTPSCHAAWATSEMGWTQRGYSKVFVQHWCHCAEFKD